MYEFIDRFKATPEFEQPLTELYGTDEWKKGIALEGDRQAGVLLRPLREPAPAGRAPSTSCASTSTRAAGSSTPSSSRPSTGRAPT